MSSEVNKGPSLVKIRYFKRSRPRIQPRLSNTITIRVTEAKSRTSTPVHRTNASLARSPTVSPISCESLSEMSASSISTVESLPLRQKTIQPTLILTSNKISPYVRSTEFQNNDVPNNPPTDTNAQSLTLSELSYVHVIGTVAVVVIILAGLSVIPIVLSQTTTTATAPYSTIFAYVNINHTNGTTKALLLTTETVTQNQCTSNFNRVATVYHCVDCENQYTYKTISYDYQAIANRTELIFAIRKDIGFFALDDISVQQVEASTANLLRNGDFELGNLSYWSSCIVTGSANDGRVESNSAMMQFDNYTLTSRMGSFYYLGGARIYPEYLNIFDND